MDCNIYFGKVVSVTDIDKINRVQVSISGLTDEIPIDELPWYYPFFGVDYLPVIDEQVPVLIFNNDFTTGFYNNRSLVNTASTFDGEEYENELLMYKRLGVQLTYNKTDGIQFINQTASVKIDEDRASLLVEDNQITLNNVRIDLGTDGEPAPLGDMTVESFVKYYESMKTMYEHMIKMFDGIKNGATSPHTKGIKMALTALIPQAKGAIPSTQTSAKNYAETIRSKKTFIE